MPQRCGVQRYTIYKQNRKTMKQIILFFFVFLPFCLYSQVIETFDGPDIPEIWIGKDRYKFAINPDGRLQLNIQPAVSGDASIGLNLLYASDMQWEFDVQMGNVPSDKNALYVYLYQEKEKFYYVRIGYSGGNKLGLCHNGNRDMFERLSNNYKKDSWVHIKVTLEENKYWTMYSRQHADSYYVEEGHCTYPVSPVEKGQFLFKFVYTKERSRLFSIDNVKIQYEITPTDTTLPETPEPSPETLPQLTEIKVLSVSALQFVFDKPVNITDAVFSVSGIGEVTGKTYSDETQTKVDVFFKEELQIGSAYTVSYAGISDLSGNKLSSFSQELVLEEHGGEGDKEEGPDDSGNSSSGVLLINEIMADPKGLEELPETEYVELYNTENKELSLAGWQFSYGGKAKPVGNIRVPAQGYAVLYRSGRDIEVDVTGIAVPLDNFPSALANTGKELQLIDAGGKVVDKVTYAKATPACSWERSGNKWELSKDPRGGTPGSKNSISGTVPDEPSKPDIPDEPDEPDEPDTSPVEPVTGTVLPGELIFNELLPEPFSGGSEYIELYNRSEHTLPVSMLSVAVRKGDGVLGTRYPLSSVSVPVVAGGYVLLTKSLEGVTSFYGTPSPENLFETAKLPVLANTSSTVVLIRTEDDVVIDEISYSSKWHASSIKDKKGVALERIDPEKETQDPANWTSALEADGYGTPGFQNSQYAESMMENEEPTGMEAPAYKTEEDSYRISYLLDKSGYNCRVQVFDCSGRLAAEIANHEALGISGELLWDGCGMGGSRLLPGVYIFHATVYHPEGEKFTVKKAFLVH